MEKNSKGIQTEFEQIKKGGEDTGFFNEMEKREAAKISINTEKVGDEASSLRMLSKSRASINIDISTAIEISANQTYNASLLADQMLLVKVNTDGMKKLTVVSQTAAQALFQTYVFVVNEAGTSLVQLVGSENVFANTDTASFLPTGGWYYILFTISSGNRDILFRLEKSDSCSVNEPNDSIYQLNTSYTDEFRNTDTFDSLYDYDATLLNVSKAMESVYFSVMFSDNLVRGNIILKILNVGTGVVEGNITLTAPFIGVYWEPPMAGLYAIYVKAADPAILNKQYQLTVGKRGSRSFSPLSVNCPKIVATQDQGNIYDLWWVIGTSMVMNCDLQGTSWYVPIQVNVVGSTQTMSSMTLGYAGGFTMTVGIPATKGQDGHWTTNGKDHYYDVNAIVFQDFTGAVVDGQVETIWNVIK